MKETLEKTYEMIESDLDAMESLIEGLLASEEPRMREFVDNFGSYRGKRVRPALVFLFARAFGPIDERHLRSAAAAELLHVATLIHDDILDEAAVRRRSETANILWGNELSVLLGDWVFAASLQAVSGLEDPRIFSSLVATAREVCQGEMLQICHRHDLSMTEERYTELVAMKTGALFGFCCETGAYLSGAGSDRVEACRQFGRNLGIAFQIIDDCLDITGREEIVGKSLGTDIAKGKMTLPVIRAFALAQGPGRKSLEEAFLAGTAVEEVRLRIDESGALAWSGDKARKMAAVALEAISAVNGRQLSSRLADLADFVLGRSW